MAKFPPQVSSRSTAAAWGCHVHNEVNKSLDKEIFDCSNIGDFYDCGCKDDEEGTAAAGSGGREGDARVDIPPDEKEPVELQKEDLQRGG